MDEPMQGGVFIIDDLYLEKEYIEEKGMTNKDQYGPFGGQLMSSVKNLCKQVFLNCDPRIVEGMYKCSM